METVLQDCRVEGENKGLAREIQKKHSVNCVEFSDHSHNKLSWNVQWIFMTFSSIKTELRLGEKLFFFRLPVTKEVKNWIPSCINTHKCIQIYISIYIRIYTYSMEYMINNRTNLNIKAAFDDNRDWFLFSLNNLVELIAHIFNKNKPYKKTWMEKYEC